jgi:orotidine-5'-phosphate decarboxylase
MCGPIFSRTRFPTPRTVPAAKMPLRHPSSTEEGSSATFQFNFRRGSTRIKAMQAKQKIIVALDVSSAEAALRVAHRLHGHVGMFKVGKELFTAEGPAVVRDLVAAGSQVFLDLKFHDIPNTVRAAAQQAGMPGVSLLTVHAAGGRKMISAAVEGVIAAANARGVAHAARVLAVTALTTEEVVVRRARLAQAAGAHGVVASPREVAAIRHACGPDLLIVTPGIRPAAGSSDDQARTATPESAIRAGADYLVIGRPITAAADPAAAADAIAAEMETVLVQV